MPQRDKLHDMVKQALTKSGWEITDDPYVIFYGERNLFVDLGAVATPNLSESSGQIVGARREGKKIAVEIKDFRRKSEIADLEQAIGQYSLYRLLINKIEPDRAIYLAITAQVYADLFNEPIGEVVINDLPMHLLIIDPQKMEIQRWIPSLAIVTS